MSKKKTEINPVPADRFNTILSRENIKQTELSEKLHLTQQTISNIKRKKQNLTDQTARAIIELFPDYRIEWLLGYDDIMTHTDELRGMIHNMADTAEAINQTIRLIADDICKRENIKRPDIPNIPDFFTLQTMLHDYAELIISDYLLNRKNSRTWIRIDKEWSEKEGKQ